MPPRRATVNRTATPPAITTAHQMIQIINTLPRVTQTGFTQMDGSLSTNLARPIITAQDAIRFALGANARIDYDLAADHTNFNRLSSTVYQIQQGGRFR